jgi:hypothetical protein
MQAGYVIEPENFCALCHAPYAEQLQEIKANEACRYLHEVERDWNNCVGILPVHCWRNHDCWRMEMENTEYC